MKDIRPDHHTSDPDVELLQRLLQMASYDDARVTGFYDLHTIEVVELFQAQHVDKRGRQLAADGWVGGSTWWALENPSGILQWSGHGFAPSIVGLTDDRLLTMEVLAAEYARCVHETPDGSNRSPVIDGYWGNTGVIGKAWCCAYVSTMLERVLNRLSIGSRHHLGVQRMWRAARAMGLVTTDPKPLDIFVQLFAGGKGHTGFGWGFSADMQRVATMEGNCGNRLKSGMREMPTIHGWIDPFQDGQGPGWKFIDDIVGEDVAGAGTR